MLLAVSDLYFIYYSLEKRMCIKRQTDIVEISSVCLPVQVVRYTTRNKASALSTWSYLIVLWYLLGAEPCFIGVLLPPKKVGAGNAGEALAPGTGVHFSTHLRGISPSRKVCSCFRFYRRVQRYLRNICPLLSEVQRGAMVRLFCKPCPY